MFAGSVGPGAVSDDGTTCYASEARDRSSAIVQKSIDRGYLSSVFWSGPPKSGWLFENWIDARRDSGEIEPKDRKTDLFG
jgi:hypothetical protein